jgi:hypothetical protein
MSLDNPYWLANLLGWITLKEQRAQMKARLMNKLINKLGGAGGGVCKELGLQG